MEACMFALLFLNAQVSRWSFVVGVCLAGMSSLLPARQSPVLLTPHSQNDRCQAITPQGLFSLPGQSLSTSAAGPHTKEEVTVPNHSMPLNERHQVGIETQENGFLGGPCLDHMLTTGGPLPPASLPSRHYSRMTLRTLYSAPSKSACSAMANSHLAVMLNVSKFKSGAKTHTLGTVLLMFRSFLHALWSCNFMILFCHTPQVFISYYSAIRNSHY